LIDLIYEEAVNIEFSGEHPHPRCSAALQAALRMPKFQYGNADDSITKRLNVARAKGAFDFYRGTRPIAAGPEAGKNNWNRGVIRLATALERRVRTIEQTGGWERSGIPSGYQAVTMDRLVATHFIVGRAATETITERWITAEEDNFSRYIVRAYAKNVPPDRPQLEVVPMLNCRRGAVRRVDMGDGAEAQLVEMVLPVALERGESTFFANRVNSWEPGPTLMREVQVTCHGIKDLTVRVQFEPDGPLPKQCWYFAEVPDVDRLVPPDTDNPRNIAISDCGFVEHRFGRGIATAKYGIAWRWD